jgi:hypothetical protein
VVGDGEALRLRRRQALEALRAGAVDVPSGRRADVAGDALRPPAEIVGGCDVREEVEPLLVPQVEGGVDEPGGLDDDGGLAVRLGVRDVAGDAAEVQLATPLIS